MEGRRGFRYASPPMRDIILVTGGARSGKSRLAEAWAAATPGPVLYLATCRVREDDAEMQSRIALHRARRPVDWVTREVAGDLPGAVAAAPAGGTVLVDCLTLWVSGLLEAGEDPERETARLAAALNREGRTLLVTNEVGMGVVPPTPLGRRFRDAAGRVNMAVAAVADRVVLCVAGLPVVVKGSAKGIPFSRKEGSA